MIPKAFFVVGGKAVSKVSALNAFDMALKEAGIEQCNLVPVSSIIPPDCEEKEYRRLPLGAVTFVVLSKAEGRGETVTAGIAWGKDGASGYGVVAEAYGRMDEAAVKEQLDARIREMAEIRNIKLTNVKRRIETINAPKNRYSCAVVVLVYVF
jgi:arginine decarboxylase